VLITSTIIARGDDHPSLSTEVVHHTPHTRAETHIRTVVFDAAHPAYSGTIHIAKGAHDCESYLNHHTLLLGEKAQSRTRPSLEILNDQVKCSHAATIRTITDLDLFYLRSRGISPEEGRDMLIEAFLTPI
jgi:Fe-S cluster assembly protein SufD